jgi:hypothetical protein
MKKKNTHKDLGFEIPDGYFDTSMDRMFDNNSPQHGVQGVPFAVPDNYFERLEDRILKNTVDKKVDDVSIDKGMPFTVPQDYFKNLEQQILDKTVDRPVVQLERNLPAWVVPMLAVAAVLVAVMAINGFWQSSSFSMEDLGNEELGMYLADSDFASGQDAINILYSDADELQNVSFNSTMDNEVLLDYLVDEVDMNLMLEE